jgi:hypothetical protein
MHNSLPDIFDWWIVWTLLDWAKDHLTLLAGFIVSAFAFWQSLSQRLRDKLLGAFIFSGFLIVTSLGQFLHVRWSVDPREIPPDKIMDFRQALPPYDSVEVISFGCFPERDSSSCRIANEYRDLLADTWSLAGSPPCLEPDPNIRGLKGRIWVSTASERDRPKGAVALHDALYKFGMHPGYRLCPAFGPNEFALTIGVQANGNSN